MLLICQDELASTFQHTFWLEHYLKLEQIDVCGFSQPLFLYPYPVHRASRDTWLMLKIKQIYVPQDD